ncbi:MAG TPA: AMP-binding protein [Streptosporangiaceae bacterium]
MSTPYDERPWLRFYPKGVPAGVQVPDVPLTRLLDDAAKRFPRRRALVFLGRSIRYRRLVKIVDRFAGALRSLGVHKGDRVALVLPNCPQQVIAFYGALRRGAVVVMNNPLYTPPELHHQLTDSGARVVVVLDRMYDVLVEALPGTHVEHVLVTSLTEYLPRRKRLALRLPLAKARALRAELTTPVPPDADVLFFRETLRSTRRQHRQVPIDPRYDLAALQYTGGTTGRPKGAMLTHRNLVANAYQTVAFDPRIRPGREVSMAVLPLFHVFGLTMCLTASMLIAGTVVLVPKFDVDLVLSDLKRWRPTIFPGVPPIYQQLAESPKARKAGMGSVRTCVSGAMKLPRETIEAVRLATGAEVIQGYGLTETSPVAMANPVDGNARHVSVGIPLPSTDARVVDENDPSRPVQVGMAGELIIRGPQVFEGYWRQPAETAEVLRNGWVRTGDIGLMSPDGFFTLIDRKRDVIIVDGLNVYPSEVEAQLCQHPGVLDAAVIGIPDPRHGEAIKAYVIPQPGPQPPRPQELIELCAQGLTHYKVPRYVEFRAELPRNMLGKVLRRVLRDEAVARARTGDSTGSPPHAT